MATEPTTNEHPLDVKIAEARADEAYLSRNHPRHTESVANVARLFSQRYPESVWHHFQLGCTSALTEITCGDYAGNLRS